jgi:ATP-dependent helicase HrpB
VSQASAAQRAGRAGRTRPGRCLRLYTQHDHDTRRPFEAPEILRADLSEATLLLACLDVPDATALPWVDPPSAEATAAARRLLAELGAVDERGAITALGRQMAELPTHPRLARLILAAAERGLAEAGCAVAALLGERDLRLDRGAAKVASESDLVSLAEALDTVERARFDLEVASREGISATAARGVARARDHLLAAYRRHGGRRAAARGDSELLLQAILAGFPDRVAKRRARSASGEDEILLARGGSARLMAASSVREAEWLVALDAEVGGAGRGEPRVRLASRIEPAWLLDLFPEQVVARDELCWNEQAERVEGMSRLSFGELTLDESRQAEVDEDAASALLREQALAAGPAAFVDGEALATLTARLALVRAHVGEESWPEPEAASAREVLAELCVGKRSFAELRRADLAGAVARRLSGAVLRRLDELAPPAIVLPGGRRLPVHYETGQPPWVESQLQDFFGMRVGPAIARGRVALTLHLLAPSRRPVQVTSDLASFWEHHYAAVRRELMRRYPKHPWPEDPVRARPPAPKRRR